MASIDSANTVTISQVIDAFGGCHDGFDMNGAKMQLQPISDRYELADQFFQNHLHVLEHTESIECCELDCGAVTHHRILKQAIRLKLDRFKDFIIYCLDKNYFSKDDPKFQTTLANEIGDFNHLAGMCSANDFEVFYYACSELLKPVTLASHRINHSEPEEKPILSTLFHQLFHGHVTIPDDLMEKFFQLFDLAGFDYATPGCYRGLLT